MYMHHYHGNPQQGLFSFFLFSSNIEVMKIWGTFEKGGGQKCHVYRDELMDLGDIALDRSHYDFTGPDSTILYTGLYVSLTCSLKLFMGIIMHFVFCNNHGVFTDKLILKYNACFFCEHCIHYSRAHAQNII